MLRAIAIYEVIDAQKEPLQFKRIESAQQGGMAFFGSDDLKSLEEKTLPFEMPRSGVAYHRADGEHHYLRKIPTNNLVIAIVSKKTLDAIELGNLFTNIQSIHFKKEIVKASLDQIIANPLGYTGKDLLISQIGNELDATRTELFKAIALMLERGEKIEELKITSQQLADSAGAFKDEAKKLNSCC